MPTELPNERAVREPGSIQLDPSGEGIAIDETRRLIASNKVEGTPVYNRAGEELGAAPVIGPAVTTRSMFEERSSLTKDRIRVKSRAA